MASPSVSVLMAVRNMEHWLPTTLDSLRTQTRTDFEVIAVDDGSTDGTGEILRTATDLPITTLRTDGVGLSAARNLAIGAASAPLLAVLDGDDMWLPCYMERVAGRLESDPDVAIVSPELLLAVEDVVTEDRYYADGYPLQWFDDDQLENCIEMNFVVPLSTYRREVIDAIGVYDLNQKSGEDWDLWIRAFQGGYRAGHIAEPCGVYRFRAGSMTTSRINLIQGRISILERLSTVDGAVGDRARTALAFQQFQLYISQGKEALRTHQYSDARAAFMAAAWHPDAKPRERAGAWLAAALPRLGATVLSRRAPVQMANRSAKEVRRDRE